MMDYRSLLQKSPIKETVFCQGNYNFSTLRMNFDGSTDYLLNNNWSTLILNNDWSTVFILHSSQKSSP